MRIVATDIGFDSLSTEPFLERRDEKGNSMTLTIHKDKNTKITGHDLDAIEIAIFNRSQADLISKYDALVEEYREAIRPFFETALALDKLNTGKPEYSLKLLNIALRGKSEVLLLNTHFPDLTRSADVHLFSEMEFTSPTQVIEVSDSEFVCVIESRKMFERLLLLRNESRKIQDTITENLDEIMCLVKSKGGQPNLIPMMNGAFVVPCGRYPSFEELLENIPELETVLSEEQIQRISEQPAGDPIKDFIAKFGLDK